ncbi:MAG: alpha/beta hydrolase [Gammaproteobacteria bacterium]
MTKKVTALGTTVAYTDRGQGEPIFCMHGNPDSRHSWEPLFAELSEGYRLIAPDFPGFGDSQPLPSEVEASPETMARFWDEFLGAAGIDTPVHVIVHDFGGPWLLPWVACYPEKVRSVFILNTVFHRDYAWHSWARIWQTPLLGELAMLLTSRWLLRREMALQAPGVPLEVVDAAYDRMHRTMKATVLRWYRSHARPAEVFDPWEDRLLAALENIPARVVWGDQDPYIPARIADRFGVEAVHLTDYGHWLHLQAPDVVAGHLAALLRDGRR